MAPEELARRCTAGTLGEYARTTVVLDEPLTFGDSPAGDLRLLRILREATSFAVRLTWTLRGCTDFPPHTHAHLIPPAKAAGSASGKQAAGWKAGYRYGRFYYRQGPGFVSIKDVRRSEDASRMVITADDAVAFLAMVRAERLDELPPRPRGMVTDAVEAGLALTAEDELLVLPYRMRHWPVPYSAV